MNARARDHSCAERVMDLLGVVDLSLDRSCPATGVFASAYTLEVGLLLMLSPNEVHRG